MNGLRLLIVDDDPVIRQIVRSLVEHLGATVLAEAENGRGAIEEAERHRPELILMDISMPLMGGLPAVRYLHQHFPGLPVIMISQYTRKAYADEALECGARGYVVKGSLTSDLEPAVEAVLHGDTFVSARVTS
jgi:response regulator NasT